MNVLIRALPESGGLPLPEFFGPFFYQLIVRIKGGGGLADSGNARIKTFIFSWCLPLAYMQKTCDVAEKAILAKKNLRKKCVNRDKM